MLRYILVILIIQEHQNHQPHIIQDPRPALDTKVDIHAQTVHMFKVIIKPTQILQTTIISQRRVIIIHLPEQLELVPETIPQAHTIMGAVGPFKQGPVEGSIISIVTAIKLMFRKDIDHSAIKN